MVSDILGAIEIIDGRIARLRELRKQLAEEFGISQKTHVSENQKTLCDKAGEKTRKEELAEFLKAHGPKTRMEIVNQTGIPAGTVSFCLKDKQFAKNEEGKWNLAKNAEESGAALLNSPTPS